MRIFFLESTNLKFPNIINKIILQTLKLVHRSNYFYLFKDNIEVLPLILNLVNAAAKYMYSYNTDSGTMYQYKDTLARYLIKKHNNNWSDGEVLYFETPYGQISAHIFDFNAKYAEKMSMTSDLDYRRWNEEHLQPIALKLIDEYIKDALN